ncbi:MAG: penicillin acylase family protein, partial [Candidatus Dormibacteraeota bacterium]|nr:penicillin acylase family protein [Candidatus Dormibacteraeota bacterium]
MVLIVAAAVVVALLIVGALVVLWLRRRVLSASLPRTRGTVDSPGVSAPVTVARDRYGVPHVSAETMADAAYAMGMAHGQDRLWQMEFMRRVAMGRVSEFAGAEGIETDRFIRRLGLFRVAREEARQATGEAATMLEAYSAGVNSQINGGRKLPLEFRLLQLQPEPWEPAHSLSVVKLLALSLGMNWDTELQRLQLLRTLGAERAAQLDIFYPDV